MLQEHPRIASEGLRGSKIGPGSSRMPLGGSNMVPRGPKMANKLLQEAPRWLQDASSRPQGGLRSAPGDPKMDLRGAKRSPRCIHEGPKWRPKMS